MNEPSDRPAAATRDESRNPLVRRWLLNLALLLVVILLAVFAWYRSAHPPKEAQPALTELDPEAVRRVEIERTNQPLVVLERGENGWRLTAPLQARADSFAVDALLRLARAPIEATVAAADGDLARYGLARPTLVVRFDGAAIRFGEMHPLKDDHYVQYGSAVHLISSRYYAQAAAKYTNLIDGRLIEPGRKPVSFKLPGFALTQKDGTWQRQPEIASLSSDRINAFVDDWRHSRALQVEKYSGRKAMDHVIITFEDEPGHKTTLDLGVIARTPELVLARPDEGLEYHFPEEAGQRLFTLNADNPK